MGRIPDEIIQQVRDRVDLVDLVGRFVSLKPAGRNHKGLCPFHGEKTHSFVVTPDRGTYKCFGCGEGGNAFGFLMAMENLTFPEAVRQLAAEHGIEIPETGGGDASVSEGIRRANAIALLDGRCVRLSRGRYDDATVYGEDPGAVAAAFARQRIPRLHVVDLDGARAGRPANAEALRAIVAAVGEVPVQRGGGIRTLEAVDETLATGVDRIILGTVALRDPALVREAAKRHPGRIVVGIDAKDGRVAVEGWLETSETRAVELAPRFEEAGVAAIVYTDIARDGMLSGPNLEATAELADAVSIPVIVSGGVASEDDLVRAAGYAPRGIAGAIVGRALYTGAVDLASALGKVARC